MKFAEIIIKPLSAFGTPLKGDTIFGHFYWQLVYDPSLLKGDLQRLTETYGHEPFVVFSSAFPRLREGWLLPRPALPLRYFGFETSGEDCFEKLKGLKEQKKKSWLLASSLALDLTRPELLNDAEAAARLASEEGLGFHGDTPRSLVIESPQPHNTINRLTFTTGEGFAPYQLRNHWFLPGMRLSVFVLYREEVLKLSSIREAFSRIGETGFGRDASCGLGRFAVEEIRELPLPKPGRVLYTLSPYVPREEDYEHIWYRPFTRFGRHGGPLVLTGRPFKNPVFMADQGAVLRASVERGPYIGRAIGGLSKAEEKTIAQGFSIVLPVEGLA